MKRDYPKVQKIQADTVKEKKILAGEFLFKQGERSKSIYIVKDGFLRVFREENNKEIEISRLSVNQLVGEMAFFDRAPRSASVQALTDCELVELDAMKFESYMENQPFWLRTIISSLLAHIRTTNAKLSSS